LSEHDFSKTPDECAACQEGRRSRRSHKPASVPGIPATAPGIARVNGRAGAPVQTAPPKIINDVLAAAETAAYEAIAKRGAEEAAKRAAADSWSEVIADINRNHSPGRG
jgi:hypothetical protein